MSLQAAAQHLASRGRGPDTTLVHMAPHEVAGLQAIAKAHGGSLTINPETGLPEAGFLSSILPMVAGAALAATGVGAPMAAMLVGGASTLATGSLGKGLMAGLGAFGGYGFGNALAGAGEAALTEAATTAGSGVSGTAATAGYTPELAAGTPLSEAGSLNAFAGNTPVAPTTNMGAAAQAGYNPQLAAGTPLSEVQGMGAAPAQQLPSTITASPDVAGTYKPTSVDTAKLAEYSQLDKMQAGLGNMGAIPTADKFKYGAALGLPLLASAMQPQQAQYQGSGPNPYDYRFEWERPGGPSYNSREAAQLRGRLTPITKMADGGPVGDMSDRNEALTLMANGGQMFAEGGKTDVAQGMTGASADAMRYLMGQAPTSSATQAAQSYASAGPNLAPMVTAPTAAPAGIDGNGLIAQALRNAQDQSQAPSFIWNPVTRQMTDITPAVDPASKIPTVFTGVDSSVFANGGIASLTGNSHLGDYSDGGRLLKGPGDGVSDSIPAVIGDKRPARLADGEFVVPARIVSELGNGSTDAGARKLYAMMDRIQQTRSKTTGKNRVAVNSRADKALPA